MSNIIIGTAGHIDHGKTTLIKALTGSNTDRLKEEQKRGISIDLGFTYFDLPSGKKAGIIDVPGHEKFIKNMLAGISGIDIVLFVVAANEGVMPQTIEHLQILNLLGIEKGFIVITKKDLVEKEFLELVREDIKETVKGTFLEGKEIVEVSSYTLDGIEEVKNLVDKYSTEVEEKNLLDHPRLPVDRIFTLKGFGTIVTGTLMSGKLEVGEDVYIYPRGLKSKVRSIQVHSKDEEIAYAGQRVAINLVDVKKDDILRGDVISKEGLFTNTIRIDAYINILDNIDNIIKNRSRIRMYIGSKEVLGRIIILDKESLNKSDKAFVQIILEEPIVARVKDRFILRFYSPMYTIGGGIILDPNAEKKKRFDESTIEKLKLALEGRKEDILENVILNSKESLISKEDILHKLILDENQLESEIDKLIEANRIYKIGNSKQIFYIHSQNYDRIGIGIEEYLTNWHKKNSLKLGIPKEELKKKIFLNVPSKQSELLLEKLIEDGKIKRIEHFISLKDFKISFTKDELKAKEAILNIVNQDDFILPRKEDIEEKVKYLNVNFEDIFSILVNSGNILKISDNAYISKECYELAKQRLKKYLEDNKEVTVADYRDLLNTNRKTAIALLEYFDSKKITKRVENKRILF